MSAYTIALSVLQKVSCFLSMTGSLMIISQVARSQYNRSKPQQRLMLCLSVCDFNTSMSWMFTNLFMPPIGNQASCDAQGYILQANNTASFLYMCALQLQYLLTIKHGWRERQIRKIEPFMHGSPICFGLGTATASLALLLFNPAGWNCWIGPYPKDCTQSYQIKQGDSDLTETDCVRGDNSDLYRFGFFYAPLWASILFCMFIMFRVYRTVQKIEQKSTRFRLGANMSMAEECRRQAIYYSASFFAVWIFPTIVRLIQLGGGYVHPILIVLSGTFAASQGLWNAMIYFRPRYKKIRKKYKLWTLVCATLFFCCYVEDYTHDKADYVEIGSGEIAKTDRREQDAAANGKAQEHNDSNVGESNMLASEDAQNKAVGFKDNPIEVHEAHEGES